MRVYDISVPLRADMPTYSGEPGPRLQFTKQLSKGDSANVSVLSLGSPPAADLDALAIPPDCRRLLFKTRNGRLWDDTEFHRDFIALAPDAARALAERGLKLVGIDYLSIERFQPERHQGHETLLASGGVILEGLGLRRGGPGGGCLGR